MKAPWIIFLVPVIACSCISTKTAEVAGHTPLTKETLSKLDGDYPRELWHYLTLDAYTGPDTTSIIRLTAKRASYVEARLIRDGVTIKKRKIRGKINEGGYFSSRSKLWFCPVPFMFLYEEKKSSFIVTDNNKLHIAHCERFAGMLFIIMNAGKEYKSLELERL